MSEHTAQEYEKAIAYIFNLIQNGTLKIGSRLPPERAIAEQLGIGRNSIREAISILHGMGFVERIQGSGNYVSKHVGKSIRQTIMIMLALGSISKQEVYEFRRAMEKSVCDSLLAKPPGQIEKEKIEKALLDMKSRQGRELADADKAFHDALIEATGNQLWITLMEAVTDVYREWIDYVLAHAEQAIWEQLLQYHEQIYQAITDGKRDAMLCAIDRHYDLIETML